MLRHYKVATLLVEFQNDKAFALQSRYGLALAVIWLSCVLV